MGPALAHVISRDVSAIIVCVAAGSRFEPARVSGAAHVVEHAAFLGAGQRDYRAIRETIDRLGGDVSAETSEEVIIYWASTNQPRDFAQALDLVADLVLAPRFDEDSVKRELGTVVQEISGVGDDVFQRVLDMAKRLLWGASAWGRPVGGSVPTVRRLGADACRTYWTRTHTPDRMLVLVAGSADESRQVRRRLGASILEGAVAPSGGPGPRAIGPAFQGVRMPGRFVRLCFGLPGIGWGDARLPAIELLNGILGRDEASHLWERIRGQGLSYDTESFVSCFNQGGWLGVLTDGPVDAAAEVVNIVLDELRNLPASLTAAEFERARESHIARVRNDETAAPLEWAKFQALHAYFLGRVPSVKSVVSELEGVTLGDVRSAARDLLRLDQLVLAVGGPRRAVSACQRAFEAGVT